MKIYALCASPRKRWNSDQLLDAFVEGVREQAPEAEVEKVYLDDLDFKGCRSCFGCKLVKGDGTCVVRDSIHDLLIDIRNSDGFVYAAPIYFCDIPGQLRAFFERLMYPGPIGRELPIAALYAMNASEHGWDVAIASTINVLHNYFQETSAHSRARLSGRSTPCSVRCLTATSPQRQIMVTRWHVTRKSGPTSLSVPVRQEGAMRCTSRSVRTRLRG